MQIMTVGGDDIIVDKIARNRSFRGYLRHLDIISLKHDDLYRDPQPPPNACIY
jgi:hypothetical protein